MSSRSSLRDRAVRLDRLGWRVFPVQLIAKPDGTLDKKPVITGYHGDGPFSDAKIDSWPWGRADALGWALPPGYVCLDVDVKNGKRGDQHLADLEALYGALPPTMTQPTLTRGRHLVFELPEVPSRFSGRVRLPRGSADIDVIHSRYRFVTVYDDALFDQEIAVLPRPWLAALTPPRRRGGTRRTPRHDPVAPVDPLVRLAEAEPGRRTATLRDVVIELACTGRWEDLEQHVLDLAREIGVQERDIPRTIDSALAYVAERQQRVRRWVSRVRRDPRRAEVRNKATLDMTVEVLADVAFRHGEPFGLSVRELGERIGVGVSAASTMLKRLRDWGHLGRDEPWQGDTAARYCLDGLPEDENENSHVSSPTDHHLEDDVVSSMGCGGDGGRLFATSRENQGVLGHTAFVRMKGTVTLPPSCVLILAALCQEAVTVKAIAGISGLSPQTVRANVHRLQSAGIVSYDSRSTRRVTLLARDIQAALDQWAAFIGSANNATVLRRRHASDRAAFREMREQAQEAPEIGGGRFSQRRGDRRTSRSVRQDGHVTPRCCTPCTWTSSCPG